MRIVITTSDEKALDYLNQVVVPAVAEGFREGHHDAEHHWTIEQDAPDPGSPGGTAEAHGVRAHITPSAGSDGAVVVFVDTDFEPDGSDGPGLRVLVNDEGVYTGVDWEPAEEDPTEPGSGQPG